MPADIVVPTKNKTGGNFDDRYVLGRKVCNGNGTDTGGTSFIQTKGNKRHVGKCPDSRDSTDFYESGSRTFISVCERGVFIRYCRRYLCCKQPGSFMDTGKKIVYEETGGVGK